jgi:nucleoside 2-deoxyribosyltransferase
MGNIASNNKCPITELPCSDIDLMNSSWPGYEYGISIAKRKQKLMLPDGAARWAKEDPFIKRNRHIIAGLIINDSWGPFEELVINDIDFFKKLLDEKSYPKTPKEKRDYLFLKLFETLNYEGQSKEIPKNNATFSYNFYLANQHELLYYLNSLEQAGYIKITNYNSALGLIRTYEGINYAISIQEEGENSNNCFIAMSFSECVYDIRSAIKTACEETKYSPILVDETNINSDSTINDAIIANLKKSKFCIADFTEQKDGVYFESGFALGQGKKVIYTCREDWFLGEKGRSHFDTNHFPHIIYKDPKELKEKLVNKIKAWI